MLKQARPISALQLKGSVDIITEFLGNPCFLVDFAINAILYQRGVYPPSDFHFVPKYGLSCVLSCNDGLSVFISNIMSRMKGGMQIDFRLAG